MVPPGIQRWYETMSLRERFMLVGFVWVAVLLWMGGVSRQLKTLNASVKGVKERLLVQDAWLDKSTEMTRKLADAYTKFDPKNTVNSNRLIERMEVFARESGLSRPTVNGERPETNEVFVVNRARVQFQNVPLRPLVQFTTRVLAQDPYIAIEDMTLRPNTINPGLLTADLKVISLELKNPKSAPPK